MQGQYSICDRENKYACIWSFKEIGARKPQEGREASELTQAQKRGHEDKTVDKSVATSAQTADGRREAPIILDLG